MIQKGEQSGIQRALLIDIGHKLKAWGFDPKPSGQDFYQNHSDGKWVFHVSFIPHKDDFDLTAHVGVRLNAIEDLVNQYDSKRNATEKRKSVTLGSELGNLAKGQPKRWTITDKSDIPEVSAKVADAFERIGLQFLHKYSNLASAYEVLGSSQSAVQHLAPILGPRYMRALASEYLLRGSSGLRSSVRGYEAKLREVDDLYLSDFQMLSHALEAQ